MAQPDGLTKTARRAGLLVPAALAFLVLVHWLVAKAILFQGLEYTSDLFSFLQMSKGVFEGRPLLFENRFGDHSAIHNYYLAPLMYPLTRVWGAYGLFIALAALLFAAVWAILKCASEAPT